MLEPFDCKHCRFFILFSSDITSEVLQDGTPDNWCVIWQKLIPNPVISHCQCGIKTDEVLDNDTN